MSSITEVVLYVDSGAADHEPEASALLLPVSAEHSPFTRIDTETVVGDRKVFTSDVYLGVFNYRTGTTWSHTSKPSPGTATPQSSPSSAAKTGSS